MRKLATDDGRKHQKASLAGNPSRSQNIQLCVFFIQGTCVLAGFETHLKRKRGAGLRALPVVSLVCVLLLALLTIVQVTHVHPVDTDGDHCPLCIVMHTAAPVAVTAAVVVLNRVESAAPIYEPHTVTRYWHPQLFTRPPPDTF